MSSYSVQKSWENRCGGMGAGGRGDITDNTAIFFNKKVIIIFKYHPAILPLNKSQLLLCALSTLTDHNEYFCGGVLLNHVESNRNKLFCSNDCRLNHTTDQLLSFWNIIQTRCIAMYININNNTHLISTSIPSALCRLNYKVVIWILKYGEQQCPNVWFQFDFKQCFK